MTSAAEREAAIREVSLYRAPRRAAMTAPPNDLPNRLRAIAADNLAVTYDGGDQAIAMMDAAEEIERLRRALRAAEARVAVLEAALHPFAEYAKHIAVDHPGWDHDGFSFQL